MRCHMQPPPLIHGSCTCFVTPPPAPRSGVRGQLHVGDGIRNCTCSGEEVVGVQVGSGGVAVTARTSDVLGKICLAAVGRDGEHGWTHPITVDRVAQGLAQFLASSSFCCTAAADVSFLSTCPRAAVPLPTHIPPPPHPCSRSPPPCPPPCMWVCAASH